MTIYCDETGNTGEQLLDPDQPVFVLASNDFDTSEATSIVSRLLPQGADVAKFKVLKRTPAGRERLKAFLVDPRVNSTRIAAFVMDKRFMVITKLVDIVMESAFHEMGEDLYKNGANLATANMLYFGLPAFSSEALVEEVLVTFVQLVRSRDNASLEAYVSAGQRLLAGCSDRQMADFMEGFFSKPILDLSIPHLSDSTLDPAIPALFKLIDTWGRRKSAVAVVHDRSKPIVQSESFFLNSMADLNEQSQLVGYDRRRFLFPLRASNLTHENSHEVPQLQIADICAGLIAHLLKARRTDVPDDLTGAFEAAAGFEWVVDAMVPTPAVTPEDLGIDNSDGSNPVESFVKMRPR